MIPGSRLNNVKLLIAAICLSSLAQPGLAQPIDFTRDIRPILSDKCFACHGPDAKHRKAKLQLDDKANVFAERDGYSIIVPGKPSASELFALLTAEDEEERMPPKKFGKELTDKEIGLIKQWIEEGATWQRHWSLEPTKAAAAPKTKNTTWARSDIDRFILEKLESKGLRPQAEADKRTLIRRVTFTLTGLPPSPDEIRAFLADDRLGAYEKLVDRLLASPHYGEHIGRYWLDAARYGDTHGLHLDNYREMWAYRDYVINAFNSNISYKQFTIEQLAGDLLPTPTQAQLIATGFNRAHVTTSEGGSIAEEVYVRNVVDRVSTTGTVFMGVTLGCAVCHDHKFDPFTQKDFYSLFAYFNSLAANPLDGNKKDHAPVIKVATPEQKQQLADAQSKLAAINKQIETKLATVTYTEPPKSEVVVKTPKTHEPFLWIDDALPAGTKKEGGWSFVSDIKHSGAKSSTRTAKGLSQHFFTGAAVPLNVGKGDKLFAHVYLDPKNPPKQIMLQFNDGTWEHRAYWGGNHIPWGGDGGPGRRPMGKLPEPGKWTRLEVDAAHVGLKPGAKINGWAFTQFDGKVHWDTAGIVTKTPQGGPTFDVNSLASWSEAQRNLAKPNLPAPVAAAIKVEPAKRNANQQKLVREHFLSAVYPKTKSEFAPQIKEITTLEKQIAQIEKAFPTTLVWKEMPKPKPAFVLNRGEYDQKGDPVKRRTPASLPAMKKDWPANRLGLAYWLTDPSNPLTARVAVNRFWQQCFGIGLVESAEDLGSQGTLPSHPELLDWLAVKFVESDWNIKALMKQLVTSASFRQRSHVSPALFKEDPRNRLLARGPRFRMDAEMIRDQALASSGLLNRKVGGPSVKPPQPLGLWFAVGYSGSNTVRFKKDSGPEKIYRRSVYTFWKRTSPPPQMDILDAPSREACRVRRERTNTPMQALMLLNDPQYVEAARALATRTVKEAGKDDQARARFMVEWVTSRQPSQADLADILRAHTGHLADYKADVAAAKQLIQVGESKPDTTLDPAELAAWTLTANLVLNLDASLN